MTVVWDIVQGKATALRGAASVWHRSIPTPLVIPDLIRDPVHSAFEQARPSEARSALLQDPLFVARPIAIFLDVAFVVGFSALGEPDQQFGHAAIVEIEFERHDGVALPLDALGELVEFAVRDQKLAAALFVVVEAVGLHIFGNVGIDQPK